MKTDSFVFYRSFYEAIRELSDDDRLNVYDSISAYALDHEDKATTGTAKALMALIKPQLDANFKKRVNGSLGGRPVQAKSDEESEDKAKNHGKNNLDETKTKPSDNQSITKAEPNVNANVNANVNGIKRESTKEKSRFVKPALTEVISYCRERNNTVDPKRFYNYYESNGWMVGRSHMKDWKAAVRTWENNGYSKPVLEEDHLPVYDTSHNTIMDDEKTQEILSLMGKA